MKRQEQARKSAQYKLLRELLQPFENAQESVQPNLVTKDGELFKELEKLKLLMARAGGLIEGLPRSREDQSREAALVET